MLRQHSPIASAFHTASNDPHPPPTSLPTDSLNTPVSHPHLLSQPSLPPPQQTVSTHVLPHHPPLRHHQPPPPQPQSQHFLSHQHYPAECDVLNAITGAMSHQPPPLTRSQPQPNAQIQLYDPQHHQYEPSPPEGQLNRQLHHPPSVPQPSPPTHTQPLQPLRHFSPMDHHPSQLQHQQHSLQQLPHQQTQAQLQVSTQPPLQSEHPAPPQPQPQSQPQLQPPAQSQSQQQQQLPSNPIFAQCYSFLNSLPVRELRKIARHHGVRQTNANKLALISRITLNIMEFVQAGRVTVDSYFSDVDDPNFRHYLLNWGHVQQIPLPSIDFLRDASERRPPETSYDMSPAHISEKRPAEEHASMLSDRPSKRVMSVAEPYSSGMDIRPPPDLSDDEFARLVLLLRHNPSIRQQYRKTVTSGPTALSGHVSPPTDFWVSTVEPIFNGDVSVPCKAIPLHLMGIIDGDMKPLVWRDGAWLRSKLTQFGAMFIKVYREYRHSHMGDRPFHEYCLAQGLDLNTSLVRRYQICAHLVPMNSGTGSMSDDELFLSMLSTEVHDPGDAVSEVGFSGDKRHTSSHSENDAPTSMNTAEYEDITRNMYDLLRVLKGRVERSMSQGIDAVNGDDIVRAIEQKETLLNAFSRAQQKATEAGSADLSKLWRQQAEEIRNMLSVLSTKK